MSVRMRIAAVLLATLTVASVAIATPSYAAGGHQLRGSSCSPCAGPAGTKVQLSLACESSDSDENIEVEFRFLPSANGLTIGPGRNVFRLPASYVLYYTSDGDIGLGNGLEFTVPDRPPGQYPIEYHCLYDNVDYHAGLDTVEFGLTPAPDHPSRTQVYLDIARCIGAVAAVAATGLIVGEWLAAFTGLTAGAAGIEAAFLSGGNLLLGSLLARWKTVYDLISVGVGYINRFIQSNCDPMFSDFLALERAGIGIL